MQEQQAGTGTETGTVKWFNDPKGFGFIKRDNGLADAFVHFTNIVGDDDFRVLAEGNRVEFDVQDSGKGPFAVNVVVRGR